MKASRFLACALVAAAAAHAQPADPRRSGYEDMSRETRAMQDDDAANPATLWVLDGEALWARKPDSGGACAECHAAGSMRGVAARYPRVDGAGRLLNVEQQINRCRAGRQGAAPFPQESRELLALSAYIGRESRGLPIQVEETPATRPFLERGRKLYERRQGQLDLACMHCHDHYAGRRLAGNPIPQGHPTGYPLYRLEWQSVGSLGRRLRNCMAGIRAEPYAAGSPELVELELYLMWRARGMKLETPAVRP